MLYLLFRLGGDSYALDTRQIVEVLPLITLRKQLRPHSGFTGSINYRGNAVPVIDLSDLMLGRSFSARLSSRIILARYTGPDASQTLLGLIAENVTETVRLESSDLSEPGFVPKSAQYLGPVAVRPHGMIQVIDLGGLVSGASDEVKAGLQNQVR